MKKVSVNIAQTEEATAIKVGQIILDDSHYLTCWGYLQTETGWRKCDFVTNYEVLNTMLRAIEDKSEAVQMAIVQKLENMEQIPEMIDFEAQLGKAVTFDNLRFYLSRPQFQPGSDYLEYTGDSCYYIRKAEYCSSAELYAGRIDQCMLTLHKNYELYLGYLELEFEENEARAAANLDDDMKYTLAYYAWKQANGR
ncbi:hypothetical protein DLD77_04705 [Chitinophaga alhagiae]|uniref:DUF4240 domain-containing protein n=1 Tax=Chitinophaga alhagiae TaxID=2203219 RepID=A0ABM6WB39_9BACT|nr:hypothetical protein [Chitinophaga alhagiae]AWO01047.1 hypothetical protein DLD77_04705 [Chitinophaga alhagiae]